MADVHEILLLREALHDAAVLAGRLSSAVSSRQLPPECAGELAAARDCILAAQQCAALVAKTLERVDAAHQRTTAAAPDAMSP